MSHSAQAHAHGRRQHGAGAGAEPVPRGFAQRTVGVGFRFRV